MACAIMTARGRSGGAEERRRGGISTETANNLRCEKPMQNYQTERLRQRSGVQRGAYFLEAFTCISWSILNRFRAQKLAAVITIEPSTFGSIRRSSRFCFLGFGFSSAFGVGFDPKHEHKPPPRRRNVLELMETSVADTTEKVPIANNSTALKKVHILNSEQRMQCQAVCATSSNFFALPDFVFFCKRSHKKGPWSVCAR